ncbi:Protein IDA-LIKE 5 [Raphanus sativus]|nr:Protein IDA-LIKE 5 [Raphanus sativus]
MGNKRIEAVMIMVVIMMVFSWRICEAESLRRHTSSSSSRPQRFFKVRRPNPLHHNHNHGFIDDDYPPESFSGLLPKTMPIPPSAPSKKHNVYGLQSTNFQRYP